MDGNGWSSRTLDKRLLECRSPLVVYARIKPTLHLVFETPIGRRRKPNSIYCLSKKIYVVLLKSTSIEQL